MFHIFTTMTTPLVYLQPVNIIVIHIRPTDEAIYIATFKELYTVNFHTFIYNHMNALIMVTVCFDLNAYLCNLNFIPNDFC